MDGNDYQRESFEKDGNRQGNNATIQDDEEITISCTFDNTSQLQLIEGRISRGGPITIPG